ncbi:C-C motif chemokine 14-like isoform X1 [Diceros bicornis minor]|uniref:C-C motif chemokine 14-like isoform X1 n=1 Tax=Diceros bicornis minor TaxID=77932 RepID=UPI0026EF65AF|nr:C-C motif chemokine 14-like isoform X1 [Diceros bicornis minor]
MKVSVAAVSFLLLIIITVTLGSKTESFSRLQEQLAGIVFNKDQVWASRHTFSSGGPHYPADCCFSYITRTIPRNRITHYYETSSQCSKPGVVFITKKGHSICANPSDAWVQDYIKVLEVTRRSGEGNSSES